MLLSLAMALSLAACGGSKPAATTAAPAPAASAAETTAAAAETTADPAASEAAFDLFEISRIDIAACVYQYLCPAFYFLRKTCQLLYYLQVLLLHPSVVSDSNSPAAAVKTDLFFAFCSC